MTASACIPHPLRAAAQPCPRGCCASSLRLPCARSLKGASEIDTLRFSELHNAAESGDAETLARLLSAHTAVDEDFNPVRSSIACKAVPARVVGLTLHSSGGSG